MNLAAPASTQDATAVGREAGDRPPLHERVEGIGTCQSVGEIPGEPLTRGCSGQATAEFALLLPLVLLAMLAVVQVARVALDAMALVHATREAARAFSIDPRTSTAQAAAEKATKLLRPDRIRVRVDGESRPGALATVRLDYRSPTDVPLVGGLVGDTRLQAEVTVVVEAWHHSSGSTPGWSRP